MARRARLARDDSWQDLADQQHGVIALRQLRGLGLTDDEARQWARTGRWRVLHPGVYATVPPSRLSVITAAVLHCGEGAAAWGPTALWLAGALDSPPAAVHVGVPAGRKVVPRPGIRVHRARHRTVNAAVCPPRATPEQAVLDCCALTRSEARVVDLVLTCTQRRLTTPSRVLAALRARPRHPWRRLVTDLLAEVGDGVTTPLELRYKRNVERAHGLPRAHRNRAEETPGRPRRPMYRDAHYRRWRLVAELDGRAANPDDEEHRDMDRDKVTALTDGTTLRYGWRDVTRRPCRVAAQVAHGLRRNGWPGTPRRCSPTCTVDDGPW